MKHTFGPWWVDPDLKLGAIDIQHDDTPETSETIASVHTTRVANEEANARLIAASPDRHDQLTALIFLGWTVEKRSLYDEEGIEAWVWTEPDGTEHFELGPWDELPSWPDSARDAVSKATGGP